MDMRRQYGWVIDNTYLVKAKEQVSHPRVPHQCPCALEEGVNTLVALCESEKFSKDTLVAEWTHSEGNARNAYSTKFTTGSFIAVDMRVVKMVVRIQRMQ